MSRIRPLGTQHTMTMTDNIVKKDPLPESSQSVDSVDSDPCSDFCFHICLFDF